MTDVIDGGLTFSGTLQPPDVPADPTGDDWRGLTGATGATGPAGDASLVSVLATGTTTPRSAADRFADTINVKDFGATGDGTNQTDALAAAFAAAKAQGKSLKIPAGTYLITSSVGWAAYAADIIGDGAADTVIIAQDCDGITISNKTGFSSLPAITLSNFTVLAKASGSAAGTKNGLILFGTNGATYAMTRQFTVSGVNIAGATDNDAFQQGILFSTSPYSLVQNCAILGSPTIYGLMTLAISIDTSTETTVRDCMLYNGVTGIRTTTGTEGAVIEGNHFVGFDTGIYLHSSGGSGGNYYQIAHNHINTNTAAVNTQGSSSGINWVFVAHNLIFRYADGDSAGYPTNPLNLNTAQAGGASTITLASTAAGTDIYTGRLIQIASGTGSGQPLLLITAYNTTTKVATVASPWATQPDATSVYRIKSLYTAISVEGKHARIVNNAIAVGGAYATDIGIQLKSTASSARIAGNHIDGMGIPIQNLSANPNTIEGNDLTNNVTTNMANAVSGGWVAGMTAGLQVTPSASGAVTLGINSTDTNNDLVLTAKGTGKVAVGTSTGGTAQIAVNSAVANYRSLRFQTAGVDRWVLQTDNGAEGGSNAGSGFTLVSMTDAGANLKTAISVARSTGVVVLPQGAQLGSSNGPSISSGTGVPSFTAVSGALFLRTDGTSSNRLYVSAGGTTWNAVAGV